MYRYLLAALAIGMSPLGPAAAQELVPADLVIRGGTIYDGTGGQPYVGGVAVRADRIVAVGTFQTAGTPQVLDAQGLCVAPGFIDLHNHSDSSITSEKARGNPNFLRQGCTTIVTGNCGGGVVDVESYFGKIEQQGAGTHVIHLMPQGAVRSAVIGSVERPPTDAELEKMRQLIDKGMRDGAFGMSTGLIYVPGTFTSTRELIELAKMVARHGGIYASHIRDEGTGVLAAIEEALSIGREAGCAVHISHLKASGPKAWGLGNDICNLIANARAAGLKVTADQYPYPASSTSLEAMVISPWVREGGRKQLLARIEDETIGPKVRQDIDKNLQERGNGSRLQIAGYSKKPEWVGKTIQQIAEENQMTPLEVCLEITRNGGAGAIHFGMSEEDVRIISMRAFVATASDGSARVPSKTEKPHPRSYGTFPRKIGEFAHRRGWLSVEQAVRSSSGLPADILGLSERGYLRAGQVADVVVFDLDRLRDPATYQDPHQYATGFKRVYVAGKEAVVDDKITGTLAGRPIRHVPKLGGGR